LNEAWVVSLQQLRFVFTPICSNTFRLGTSGQVRCRRTPGAAWDRSWIIVVCDGLDC